MSRENDKEKKKQLGFTGFNSLTAVLNSKEKDDLKVPRF